MDGVFKFLNPVINGACVMTCSNPLLLTSVPSHLAAEAISIGDHGGSPDCTRQTPIDRKPRQSIKPQPLM